MNMGASLVAETVKNLPVMSVTGVQFLGQEGPLEKGMATHSSILAWEIPWTEEPGRQQSMGLQRVGHDWATNTSWKWLWWCWELSHKVFTKSTGQHPTATAVYSQLSSGIQLSLNYKDFIRILAKCLTEGIIFVICLSFPCNHVGFKSIIIISSSRWHRRFSLIPYFRSFSGVHFKILSGSEDKLNSYLSWRQGWSVSPNLECSSQTPPDSWPLSLSALSALVSTEHHI